MITSCTAGQWLRYFLYERTYHCTARATQTGLKVYSEVGMTFLDENGCDTRIGQMQARWLYAMDDPEFELAQEEEVLGRVEFDIAELTGKRDAIQAKIDALWNDLVARREALAARRKELAR